MPQKNNLDTMYDVYVQRIIIYIIENVFHTFYVTFLKYVYLKKKIVCYSIAF